MENSPVTIRHLIAASTESERKKLPYPLILRAVPFKWKKTHRNTRDRKTNIMERREDNSEDSDEFSDALSHAEACSLTMVSDINTADEEDGSDTDDDDEEEEEEEEETRNFMMERFLPSATAMAHPHPTPVNGSSKRRPLPRPSRPHSMKDRKSYYDDEEENRMQLKLACGGLFPWRLKNTRSNPLSFLSPRRKPNTNTRSVYRGEDDETSSGTDDERAVIIATRRKAWEARYKQQQRLLRCSSSGEIGEGLLNRISYKIETRTHSPLRNRETSPNAGGRSRGISPYRNVSVLNEEGKGFLGFPGDRHDYFKTINANDVRQLEHYYSTAVSSKTCYMMHSDAQKNIEESPVLPPPPPPPLPKSPSESWLWRVIPLLNNNSSTTPMKAERQDFDDAKWEI